MPVYVNHTDATGLRKLKGVGKAVAREIIKKCQQVSGRLKLDDIKGIVRIPAATSTCLYEGLTILWHYMIMHSTDTHRLASTRPSLAQHD